MVFAAGDRGAASKSASRRVEAGPLAYRPGVWERLDAIATDKMH